jgi:hypothetical protein
MKNSFAFGVAMEEMAANVSGRLRVDPPICPSVESLRPTTKIYFLSAVGSTWSQIVWESVSLRSVVVMAKWKNGIDRIHKGNGRGRMESIASKRNGKESGGCQLQNSSPIRSPHFN